MVVTVACRHHHDEVVELVAAALGHGSGGGLPERTAPGPAEPVVIVEHDDTEQANLCLGWRSLAALDDDRWAMAVANQILGGGMASRLFQEIRERSEEHTSELQSLMRISYAVFCLEKKKRNKE